MTDDRMATFQAMLQDAERADLTEPPPYATEAARSAWQTGYRDALRDLANGKIGWVVGRIT